MGVLEEKSVVKTTISRSSQNTYSGKLMARAKLGKEEVLVCRFVEENGVSAYFKIGKDAIPQFNALEMYTVYTFGFPSSCVRNAANISRTGIRNHLEVLIQWQLKKLVKSEFQFLARPLYNFVDWNTLSDLPDNTFVDIMGRVTKDAVFDTRIPHLPMLKVELAFQEKKVDVVFLGDKAKAGIERDDLLVIGGIKLKSFRYNRTLETGFVTMWERNPRKRKGLEELENIGDAEPKSKALKVSSLPTPLLVKDIEETVIAKLMNTKELVPPLNREHFLVTGTLTPLKETFFEEDVPLVGAPEQEKMCWRTQMQDVTASIAVKVWDNACSDLFGVNAG